MAVHPMHLSLQTTAAQPTAVHQGSKMPMGLSPLITTAAHPMAVHQVMISGTLILCLIRMTPVKAMAAVGIRQQQAHHTVCGVCSVFIHSALQEQAVNVPQESHVHDLLFAPTVHAVMQKLIHS